jgi:hypothetical protein
MTTPILPIASRTDPGWCLCLEHVVQSLSLGRISIFMSILKNKPCHIPVTPIPLKYRCLIKKSYQIRHVYLSMYVKLEACRKITNLDSGCLFTKWGSTAKKYRRKPITTLIVPTKWNANRHPETPSMVGTPASMMAQKPPIIPPTFPTACKTPNANPRLCVSVESATNDWMDGNASASPRPFSALQAAIWSQRKLMCEEKYSGYEYHPDLTTMNDRVLHKPLKTSVHLLITLTLQWFNHIKIYFKQWINEMSI